MIVNILNSADAVICHVSSDMQRKLRLPAYKQEISILGQENFTHSSNSRLHSEYQGDVGGCQKMTPVGKNSYM